jgi:RNA polymerase sigma factor (sigma-70 family)
MTANPVVHFLRIFRRRASVDESQEQSDGRLLERFVGGDGDALETLVRRHAPMVWGVCRRNLARPDDAEDAFQATFLVLLRKAGTIRPRERLANWLYGVAYKTACKARQTAAKRGAHEIQVETMPEPPAKPPEDGFGKELLTLLDRELSGLPDKYRTAIVLCYLQGRTVRDAAQQLGVADGTVASRLARGRQMLAQRMSRHGAGLSAYTVAAMCSQQAAPGVLPEAMLTHTIDAVRLLEAGQPVLAGLLRAEASTLSDAVLHAMASRKAATRILLLAPAILIAALLVAFWLNDPRRTIIGKWSGQGGGTPWTKIESSLEFFPDGTLETDLTDSIPPPNPPLKAVETPIGFVMMPDWSPPPGKHTTGRWSIKDKKTIAVLLTLPSGELLEGIFTVVDKDVLKLVADAHIWISGRAEQMEVIAYFVSDARHMNAAEREKLIREITMRLAAGEPAEDDKSHTGAIEQRHLRRDSWPAQDEKARTDAGGGGDF